MFSNSFNQKVYIREMLDPISLKHYRVEIHMTFANCGMTEGWVCTHTYLSDFDPRHDIMVGIGRQIFLPEDIVSEGECILRLEDAAYQALPDAAVKYEKMLEMYMG